MKAALLSFTNNLQAELHSVGQFCLSADAQKPLLPSWMKTSHLWAKGLRRTEWDKAAVIGLNQTKQPGEKPSDTTREMATNENCKNNIKADRKWLWATEDGQKKHSDSD